MNKLEHGKIYVKYHMEMTFKFFLTLNFTEEIRKYKGISKATDLQKISVTRLAERSSILKTMCDILCAVSLVYS